MQLHPGMDDAFCKIFTPISKSDLIWGSFLMDCTMLTSKLMLDSSRILEGKYTYEGFRILVAIFS